MKKLFIIGAMVILLTCILNQRNQAEAQQPAAGPVPARQGQDSVSELQKQGIEYRKKGLFNQSIQAFNQGLEMNPRHAGLYINRGITYLKMKNPDSAISDFNQGLSLATRGQDAIYFYRGFAYGSKKQYDAALKDFNEAIRTNPNALKYFYRGFTYEYKGQYSSAIADFNQAIKLSPSDPGSYFRKASCLDKSGQQKEAIEAYRVYLRYAKDPKSIQRTNERISELKEELKPLAKKGTSAKKPKAQTEADHFSGPLGEEAF